MRERSSGQLLDSFLPWAPGKSSATSCVTWTRNRTSLRLFLPVK